MSNTYNNPSQNSGTVAPWTRWQDWVNLILGIWLFIAPWIWSSHMAAGWNAWVLGVIVVVMALWALATPSMAFPEWVNVIAGIWLFIAPWVLGYYSVGHSAAWNQWVVGVIVFILSIWVATTMGGSSTTTHRHMTTT